MPPRIVPIPFSRLATPRISLYRSLAAYSTSQKSTLKITSVPAPHTGHIKIISLNRPEARNALSRQLLSDLSAEIESLHAEPASGPTRAVVLASESDICFCAGADLKERRSFTEADTAAFLKTLRSTFSRLASLPIPSISAVSSTALGGGLELALCTTLRVFSATATVALPETRLAILPGAGGTFRLPALIGPARAADMILTGRRIAGPEAYFLGLCDRLVGEVTPQGAQQKEGAEVMRERTIEVAVALAREICQGGPVAIRAALGAVQGWREGEPAENRAYDVVVKTKDRDEALKAFGEKRRAVFRGE